MASAAKVSAEKMMDKTSLGIILSSVMDFAVNYRIPWIVWPVVERMASQ